MHHTNSILENSGANFRYRSVATKELKRKENWDTYSEVLNGVKNDLNAKKMADDVKADGTYYLVNLKDGNVAGRAWLKADKEYMVAASKYSSDDWSLNTVAHELAHNMGVQHAGESTSYNQGLKNKTVMGEGPYPFYSTPHRYTRDGEPLGIEGKIDAVRTMNERSAQVAAFR